MKLLILLFFLLTGIAQAQPSAEHKKPFCLQLQDIVDDYPEKFIVYPGGKEFPIHDYWQECAFVIINYPEKLHDFCRNVKKDDKQFLWPNPTKKQCRDAAARVAQESKP